MILRETEKEPTLIEMNRRKRGEKVEKSQPEIEKSTTGRDNVTVEELISQNYLVIPIKKIY